MYENRPEDWPKAVAVDDAVRDMRHVGIKEEVYVSATLIPLRDLPSINFGAEDEDLTEHHCNSGACFI